MQHEVQNDCNLLQYADNTMVFKSDSNIHKSIASLEKNVKKLLFFFVSHRLTMNAGKTEFIIFCRKAKNDSMNNLKFKVHNQVISAFSKVNHLGTYQDQNLNYQIEINNILCKMALEKNSVLCSRHIPPKNQGIAFKRHSGESLALLSYFTKRNFRKPSYHFGKTVKVGNKSMF